MTLFKMNRLYPELVLLWPSDTEAALMTLLPFCCAPNERSTDATFAFTSIDFVDQWKRKGYSGGRKRAMGALYDLSDVCLYLSDRNSFGATHLISHLFWECGPDNAPHDITDAREHLVGLAQQRGAVVDIGGSMNRKAWEVLSGDTIGR